MQYAQTPPVKARYHERDVDVPDPTDEPTSSDRVRRLRPGAIHPSGFKNDLFASDRPPTARRITRTFARYFVAVLVGVAATLGWQSYGADAMETARARDPWLGRFLPVSTTTLRGRVTSAEVQQQLKAVSLDRAIV